MIFVREMREKNNRKLSHIVGTAWRKRAERIILGCYNLDITLNEPKNLYNADNNLILTSIPGYRSQSPGTESRFHDS